MIGCLALTQESHLLLEERGGLMVTACGVAIGRDHVAPEFIAAPGADLTCARCRAAAEKAAAPRATPHARADAKSLVLRLFTDVVAANDAAALPPLATDKLVKHLSTARLQRLHELFPSWRATVIDMLAEGDGVFVRYRVDFTDAFGLLGPAGCAVAQGQALLARVDAGRLGDIQPIADDFGIWRAASAGTRRSSLEPCAC